MTEKGSRPPGSSGAVLGLNMFDIYPAEGTIEVKRALAGEAFSSSSKKNGRQWDTWKLPIANERGEITHAVGITLDVTDARHSEQELRSNLELVQKQQQVIRALATPIIQVWDRVLTLPLVGMFDTGRAAEVMESVLLEVARTRARLCHPRSHRDRGDGHGDCGPPLEASQGLRLLGAEGSSRGFTPRSLRPSLGSGWI